MCTTTPTGCADPSCGSRRARAPMPGGRRPAGTRLWTWSPTGSPAPLWPPRRAPAGGSPGNPTAAARLARTILAHGPDAVGVYLGNPNAHALASATHALPLVKSPRTRNRFSATTVDQAPHQLVSWQLFGHQLLIPIADLDRTSYLLVFGANPMASNGSLMTAPDFPKRARAIKERGGRIVVLDPRRTETAKIADEHHFVRPGTDVVVLLAMLRTLLAEGLARPPTYVDGVERLRELVEPFTVTLAEEVGRLPAGTIERITREFAGAESGAAYGRVGVSTTGFGSL